MGQQEDEVVTVDLCRPCEDLFKDGKYCNVCVKAYDECDFLYEQGKLNDADSVAMEIDTNANTAGPPAGKKSKKGSSSSSSAVVDLSSKWGTDTESLLKCQVCGSHVHADCCGITLAEFDRMRQGMHPVLNKSFYCPSCCSKHAITIIQSLRKLDTLFIFHLPVTDAVAPNYRDVVKEPMDLQTMEKRAREGKDKNYLWVRESFEQIVFNALIFNADLGKIWLEAKKFYERGLRNVFEGQSLTGGVVPVGGSCPPSKYNEKIIANFTSAYQKALKERERVVVDIETKKKDLVAGHIEEIKILPLVEPPNLETCIPRAMVSLTAEETISCSFLDCCFVCGSSGANDVMMFCIDCGEAFHSFCSGAPIECMDAVAIASWRCSNCKVCELTGMATKNEVRS